LEKIGRFSYQNVLGIKFLEIFTYLSKKGFEKKRFLEKIIFFLNKNPQFFFKFLNKLYGLKEKVEHTFVCHVILHNNK